LPDSAESRLRALEQRVSALDQQMSDTVQDVRMFYPLVAGQDVLREKLDRINKDIESLTRQIDEIRETLKTDRRERELGQAARVNAEKHNSTLVKVGVIALCGTFVTSIAAVAAALLV
jgi:peptidoglycan hydrolase CwlO-like protein